MSNTVTDVDHTRGLCGEPNLTSYGLSDEDIAKRNLPREIAEKNPPTCLCCGAVMNVRDCSSDDMNRLGVYLLTCSSCPFKPSPPHDPHPSPEEISLI